jgi:signal transduction histidine kinase
MDRQQRFMADAAHELRTPIAILQTRLELLPDTEQNSRVLLDVARLSSMADQLLDLQRMDLAAPNFQRVDLVDLASNVAGDLAPLAIAAGDEIVFESEVDRMQVLGDAGALSRAVTNLVQNAIAHGGENTKITIKVCQDGRLEVTDTGPGIEPSQREEIFEPFHRVVPLRHGAGLGLSLVRDIVQRHGGRVVARSGEEGGALFEIVLPLAPAAFA